MVSAPHSDTHPLVRKLESIFDLAPQERQAILALPVAVRELRADQDIVRDHDRPSQCCLILEGFACRYKDLGNGKRQIFSFHIPGDIPDLQSLHLAVMDHSIGTLTPARVAFIGHDNLRGLLRAHPRIADACWRDTLIDSAIFREWMAGLGRREAPVRIAHLFCEMFLRMKAVGLAEGDTCALPVTQAELADALGLSNVHVNRSLQKLRESGAIALGSGRLTVKDWTILQELGEFEPTYLHLKPGVAEAA